MGTSTSQCLSLSSCHAVRRRRSITRYTSKKSEAKLIEHRKMIVDLNRATEDELLSLPDIDRQLAENILQYRQKSDGFQHVDQLLQVPGIDTDLFIRIRSDVVVGRLPSAESDDRQSKLVNLNSAPVDRLCSVPGLTPILVKRIVQRRERKGPFRFIEDLLEVKGVDYIVLAQVRPHVTVNPSTLSASLSQSSIDNLHQPILNGYRRKTRVGSSATDTFSIASQLLETLPLELQTLLLTSPPAKPSVRNDADKPLFRFASWNLTHLTNEKVQNPGVREVICRTILDNGFSLVGLQEIENEQVLKTIVDELNNPTIPSLKELASHSSKRWKSAMAGQDLAFLYDESSRIDLKQVVLFPLDQQVNPPPYAVHFRLNEKHDCLFVNTHLTSEESEENQQKLIASLVDNPIGEKCVIIFGDFNLNPDSSLFEALINRQYFSMIDTPTDIALSQPQGSTCLDNIWLSSTIKSFSTGKSGVIRDNLSSLWIPAGWTWGGLVSDHCPIWTEFNFD